MIILDDRFECLLDGTVVIGIQRDLELARVRVAPVKHWSEIVQLATGVERPEHRNECFHDTDCQIVHVTIWELVCDSSPDIGICLVSSCNARDITTMQP